VILDPIVIVERVWVDVGRAPGDVVQQFAEAIGDREVARGVLGTARRVRFGPTSLVAAGDARGVMPGSPRWGWSGSPSS